MKVSDCLSLIFLCIYFPCFDLCPLPLAPFPNYCGKRGLSSQLLWGEWLKRPWPFVNAAQQKQKHSCVTNTVFSTNLKQPHTNPILLWSEFFPAKTSTYLYLNTFSVVCANYPFFLLSLSLNHMKYFKKRVLLNVCENGAESIPTFVWNFALLYQWYFLYFFEDDLGPEATEIWIQHLIISQS